MNIRKNVIIHFFGKLIPALANLVIMIAGLRLLGKSVFGEYSLRFNAIMILSSLGVGWLQQAILRFVPGAGSNESKGVYLFLALCSSAIVSVFAIAFGFYYFHITGLNLFVYGAFAFLFSLFSVQLSLMQASFQPLSYAIGESFYYFTSSLLLLAGILLLGMNTANVYFSSMLIALMLVETGFFFFPGAQQHFKSLSKPANDQFYNFFGYGYTLTVWIMIATLYNYLDRFLIEHFESYEQVGLYSSVYDLVFKVSGFLSLPVLLAYHPAIAKAWNEKDVAKAKALIKKSIAWEAITLLVMFALLYLFLTPLFELLFNIHDDVIKQIFIPLSCSAGLWQLVLLLQKPLEFSSRRNLMIAGIIISLALNGLLNYFLIPVYGFQVAAWTTFFCTFVYVIIIYFGVKKYLRNFSTFAP